MREFANKVREQAADAIRPLYHQEANSGTDPIVELIGFLLEDGAGGVLSLANAPVTTDQWLTWNQEALERQEELIQTMTEVLEEEKMELPSELEAMRNWAACLLLSTLDRMEML